MLRVTKRDASKSKTVLFLEGKISKEWIIELQTEIEKCIEEGKKIILDFSRVSFIDEEAVKMINQWPPQKVEMRNGSLFIRTMLSMKKR